MKTFNLKSWMFWALSIIVTVATFLPCSCSKDDKPNPVIPSCQNNDSFGCATGITVGDTITEKIESVGDKDYFSFATSQAGLIQMEVNPVPADIRMAVYVYDAQQTQIAWSIAPSNGQGVFLASLPLLRAAGTYYVKLGDYGDDASSADDYKLLVRLDTSDANEINNAFSTATSIALDQSVQGKIGPAGDVDYFKFTTSQAGLIQVQVDPVPSDIRMAVYVYDSTQTQIGYLIASSNGQGVNLNVDLTSIGTYYVRLSDYGDNSSSTDYYALTVSQ